jgi:hypothetical protein
MKIFSKIITIVLLLLALWSTQFTQAGWIKDLTESGTPRAYVCQWDNECWIDKWVEVLKNNLNDVETQQSASEYIQNIVVYLIGFISIIAVVYIIYAGFNILTGTGDEEKIKKSKGIIIYVIIWLAVIYLAYSIVTFVFNVFDQTSQITGIFNNII